MLKPLVAHRLTLRLLGAFFLIMAVLVVSTPGQGTEVSVSLPLARHGQEDETENRETAQPPLPDRWRGDLTGNV